MPPTTAEVTLDCPVEVISPHGTVQGLLRWISAADVGVSWTSPDRTDEPRFDYFSRATLIRSQDDPADLRAVRLKCIPIVDAGDVKV